MSHLKEISLSTQGRNQVIDITDRIQKLVDKSGIRDGMVIIFVPHTTAAVTLNENTDPFVKSDMLGFLERLIPQSTSFRHIEENSDSHIKSSLVGPQISIFIADGQLVLGTWQGIDKLRAKGCLSQHSLHKVGRQCVGVKGRVPFSRAFSGDPLPGKILEDPTRGYTPTPRQPPTTV